MVTITIDRRMSKRAAAQIAGTIGFPSKMPGTSYGLPAKACHTGAKLRLIPGSTCHDCYAFNGNYQYPSVESSQATRLAAIDDPQWVPAMVTQLAATHASGKGRNGAIDAGWHRWHDSGDIQSVAHLTKICEVARLTPQMWHWLPTRELGFVTEYVKAGGIVPDNLTIRVSATMVDGPATKAWPTTSVVRYSEPVRAGAWECPAPKQGNACKACRACWNRDVPQVSYHKH